MFKALTWIRAQFLHVLPAVVFFFVAFAVIALTTQLMVMRHGIAIASLPALLIGASVVGKVLLVIDNLSFANAFAKRPLIYTTLWKTFIYSFAGLLYRLVENFVPFVTSYKQLGPAYGHFVEETDWARFWAVQIWVILLFFFFALVRGFIHALGRERVLRIFFGRQGEEARAEGE